MAQLTEPGPTGRFPEGKLNEHDEGELSIRLYNKDGHVNLEFGTAVAWLALKPLQAHSIAEAIRLQALKACGKDTSDLPGKYLWMTVGLPRSGKTKVATTLNIPIVNPDSIRLALHGKRYLAERENEVWVIAHQMVNALFLAGHEDVCLDATNISRKRRDDWACELWNRRFIMVDASKEECLKRALEDDDHEIIPIIEKMSAEYEPITEEELTPWELGNSVPSE